MCRILGAVNRPFDMDVLNTIKHGGPDKQVIKEMTSRDGRRLTFGHTRLSIVDLSEAGTQPMTTPDGRYTIIFNGEVYNHMDLRKEIKFNDYRGHSDTETILHYLAEKGVEGISRLNGIFGIAFYDLEQNRIVLARDPYGVKPVYYAVTKDYAVFSSEIRPIRKLIPTTLNEEALPVLLSMRHLPSPYTLFNEIEKLRPGHYGIIDLNKKELSIELKPFIGKTSKVIDLSFEDAVHEYGVLIEKAITRQLMGDVDMGMLLSGGVDSALVAGIAQKNCNHRMKAFTVGFDSKYSVNEIDWAKETAAHFGLEHHIVTMDEGKFFDIFSECARIVEEPLGTDSQVPMYYLSQLASQYVKVVLTGQGADEPLGGYDRYQGELLRARYPEFLFKLMKYAVPALGIKNEKILRGARSLGIHDTVKRLVNEYTIYTDKEILDLTGREIGTKSEDVMRYFHDLCCRDEQSPLAKNLTIDAHVDLADDLLIYTDKITMNFALEARVPLLDHELVNFIESLPLDYKVKMKQTKIVHKAFAKSYLPDFIINRRKLGFRSPTDIWFREKFDYVQGKLLDGKLASVMNRDAVQKILQQHLDGYNRQRQIFMLLSINEWMDENL